MFLWVQEIFQMYLSIRKVVPLSRRPSPPVVFAATRRFV